MIWQRTLLLGDSLTSGARDPFESCWPLYFCHLAQADGVVVVPEIDAVPGRTSHQLARAVLPAILKSEASEAYLLIGTNDAKEEVATPAPLLLANVRLIVGWLHVRHIRAYVMTLPRPCGFGSPGYTAQVLRRIDAYNEALARGFGPDCPQAPMVDLSDLHETVDGIHLSLCAAQEVALRAWMRCKQLRTLA
jgi:lysophospholipase L1-like esterase